MKVSELFEVIAKGAVSLRGKTHKGCGGKFDETTQMDDMDGVLHCTKCKKEVQSRVQPAELKKLTEGYAIKLKNGELYKTERPTLGPVKGGNSQVVVFKNAEAADDFLVVQSSRSGAHARKFEDAEIKRYNKPKAIKEGFEAELADAVKLNWLSWPVSKIVALVKKQIGTGKWPELKGKSDDELHDYVDNAKDDARNQVDEAVAGKGHWVIKNKDGVEKRFKDDESPAAKAWKDSAAKKRAPAVKAEKYSQEWWEAKEDKAERYGDVLTPWSRIELGVGGGDLSNDEVEAVGKDQGFGTIDDFHKLGTGETKVDGVHCATIRIRVVAVYTKEDDLGIEGDEPVSDSYNVMLRRDTQNPKKFVFMRYL
jgi:hypothetical protein